MFCRVFDHVPEGGEVEDSLLSMQQGDRRVVEYALEFCTLAAESSWNELVLKAAFRQGLDVHGASLSCR